MQQWWSTLTNRFRFQKIRSRFLAAMILLSMPALFLLGYISFEISKDTLMETNMQTNQDHLRTSSEVADLVFRNAINLNRSIVLNEKITADLRTIKDNPSVDKSQLRSQMTSELQDMININFINSRFVDSVCVLDVQYDAYCLGRSDNTGIYGGEEKAEAIEQSAWYQSAVKSQGRVMFLSHNVLGDSSDTFSTVKLYRDSSNINGDTVGVLIINISKSIFDSFFSGDKTYGGEFIALDTSGSEVDAVYTPKASELKEQLHGSLSSVQHQMKDQGYLTVSYPNETTGWLFVYAVKTGELLKASNQIGSATAIIATGIALVALVVSYFLSGSITKPLLQVKKMMVEWSHGRRHFEETTFEQDEVGAIGETFKRMTAENKELSEKLVHTELREREAELRALQAQIKPHFLYNTLDSIYWMATLQKHKEAAQMALSLSQSFKLSLNKGREMILLSKELEHIHHYMTIQNIRYNNRFQYVEEIEPSLRRMEILKLLLQPLVENAIYHGLEPKVGEGSIFLSGKKEGDFIVFVVEDNGVGIEDLAKVQEGYGLQSVRERIRMFYGPASSLNIDSSVNKGTRVELKLYSKHAGGDFRA